MTKQELLSLRPLNSILKRLSSATKVDDVTGCNNWTGSKDRYGYGKISMGHRRLGAHRVAYVVLCEDIPDDHVIMHSCDNPSCINLDHLSHAPQASNVLDCINKGRFSSGNLNSGAKRVVAAYSDSGEVLFFRDIYHAERFGFKNPRISESCLYGKIYKGYYWSYIDTLSGSKDQGGDISHPASDTGKPPQL